MIRLPEVGPVNVAMTQAERYIRVPRERRKITQLELKKKQLSEVCFTYSQAVTSAEKGPCGRKNLQVDVNIFRWIFKACYIHGDLATPTYNIQQSNVINYCACNFSER